MIVQRHWQKTLVATTRTGLVDWASRQRQAGRCQSRRPGNVTGLRSRLCGDRNSCRRWGHPRTKSTAGRLIERLQDRIVTRRFSNRENPRSNVTTSKSVARANAAKYASVQTFVENVSNCVSFRHSCSKPAGSSANPIRLSARSSS